VRGIDKTTKEEEKKAVAEDEVYQEYLAMTEAERKRTIYSRRALNLERKRRKDRNVPIIR